MKYEILSSESPKHNPLKLSVEFTRNDWDTFDDPDLVPVYTAEIYGSAFVEHQEPLSFADNPDDFYGYTDIGVVLYLMEVFDSRGILLPSFDPETSCVAEEVQEMFEDLDLENLRKDMQLALEVYGRTYGLFGGNYNGETGL